MMDEATGLCAVCGDPLDEIYSVTCMSCGKNIHFPAADTSQRTCAYVVTQLYVCALAFLCKNCAEQRRNMNLKS